MPLSAEDQQGAEAEESADDTTASSEDPADDDPVPPSGSPDDQTSHSDEEEGSGTAADEALENGEGDEGDDDQDGSASDEDIDSEDSASSSPLALAPAPSSLPARGATLGDSLVQSAGNEWQIVEGKYAGNSAAAKTTYSADGDVRVQKNVVPTDDENEFLVYLSIDKLQSWKGFLDDSQLAVTTSDKYHSSIGQAFTSVVGNFSSRLYESGVHPGGTNRYYVEINVFENASSTTPLYSYHDWRYGNTSNCSNATGFLVVPNMFPDRDGKYTVTGYVCACVEVNLHNGSGSGTGDPVVFNLYLDSLGAVFSMYDISLASVTDTMGDCIEFLGFEGYTGQASESDGTITWNPGNPEVSGEYSSNPVTGWQTNVAELVYRVRLDVGAAGFNSCASNMQSVVGDDESYAVNAGATLSFQQLQLPRGPSASPDVKTLDFPVPYVRGLLYNVGFVKYGEKPWEGRTVLEGAEFSIYPQGGTGGQAVATAVSGSDGAVKFTDLPYGKYTIVETGYPEGFVTPAGQASSWDVSLSYTDEYMAGIAFGSGNLVVDADDASNATDKTFLSLEVDNTYQRVALQITKLDSSTGQPLSGARFNIYEDADPDDGDFNAAVDPVATVYSDASCTQPVDQQNGLETDGEGKATFYGLSLQSEGKSYWIVETYVPSGYQILSKAIKVVFTSTDEAVFYGTTSKTFTGGICTVSIENEPVPPLPITGVVSDAWPYLPLGILLLAIAAVVLVAALRRKRPACVDDSGPFRSSTAVVPALVKQGGHSISKKRARL